MPSAEDLRAAIAAVPERSVAAQLRKVMPEIDRRVREGASYEAVVEALRRSGVDLTVNTLKSYLYRWRKRQGQQEPIPAAGPPAAAPLRQPSASASAPAPLPRIQNKGDLVRLREETEFDLDALARLARDGNKE